MLLVIFIIKLWTLFCEMLIFLSLCLGIHVLFPVLTGLSMHSFSTWNCTDMVLSMVKLDQTPREIVEDQLGYIWVSVK